MDDKQSSFQGIVSARDSDVVPKQILAIKADKRDSPTKVIQDPVSPDFASNGAASPFAFEDNASLALNVAGETNEAVTLMQSTDDPMSILEARYDRLKALLRCCRLLEAGPELSFLDKELSAALGQEQAWSAEVVNSVNAFERVFRDDAMLRKMRALEGRTAKILGATSAWLSRAHVKWRDQTFVFPKVDKDFKCRMRVRAADADEFTKDGGLTQLIVSAEVIHFPGTIIQYAAINHELDLSKKEWIACCENYFGAVKDSSALHSAMMVTLTNIGWGLPKQQVVIVRDFVMCPKSPLEELCDRPGMLMVDQSCEEDCKEYEGWSLPSKEKNSVRMRPNSSVYFHRSPDMPELTNINMVSKLSVPLPPAIVPIRFLMKFMSDFLAKYISTIKKAVIDDWDQTGYPQRIKDNPDFYGAIAEFC